MVDQTEKGAGTHRGCLLGTCCDDSVRPCASHESHDRPDHQFRRPLQRPRGGRDAVGRRGGRARGAELYWLTTVRADGRPHVTPLIGVHHDGAVHFCTGSGEQKARNLEHSAKVALTTGTNTWAAGLDVVVEGEAVRVADNARLQELADAYRGEVRRGLALRRRRRRLRGPGRGPRPTSSASSRPRCSRSRGAARADQLPVPGTYGACAAVGRAAGGSSLPVGASAQGRWSRAPTRHTGGRSIEGGR